MTNQEHPQHGKFYWVEYVGGDPRLIGARTIGRFTQAPYNQPLRAGVWHVVAATVDGFAFNDFRIISDPIDQPVSA